MKGILFFNFLFLASVIADAQMLKWAKQMGQPGIASGHTIVTDAVGNVYTSGRLLATGDFDPGTGIYNLSANSSNADMFVSKLDSAGNFFWAKQIGGGTEIHSQSMGLDAGGNVYISGKFNGNTDFDPGPGVYTLSGNGDFFVLKLSNNGNFIWVKQLQLNAQPYGDLSNIAVDASGNIFTTGFFSGTADFDPGPDTNLLTANVGLVNSFISKLDAAGNFIWAKQIIGNVPQSYSIVLDSSNNIYAGGFFGGPEATDFDPGPGIYNLAGRNTSAFVLKLTPAGNFVWATKLGSNDDLSSVDGLSVAVDKCGNVYTTGRFNGTIDFDPGPGSYNLVARGNSDNFVTKLNNDGNHIWTKQIGNPGSSAYAYRIVTDIFGNTYSVGYFDGQVDFDPGPGVHHLIGREFLLKLDGDGLFVNANQFGYNNNYYTIATDLFGNIFITGGISGTIDFDAGPGTYEMTAVGDANAFVHKMGPCVSGTSSFSVTACKSYTWSYPLYKSCANSAIQTRTFDSSGVYTAIVSTAGGCDSIITLYLTIDRIQQDHVVSSCNTYTRNGITYTTSGIYTDTLTTTSGCDSISTLHLTINSPSYVSISKTICKGQSYAGYNASGSYMDIFVAANGCDSARNLELEVLPGAYLGPDTSLCPGDSIRLYPGQFLTYSWQDGSSRDYFTVKQPGLYAVTVTDSCGVSRDETMITEKICGIYFPSGFTPNNDGKNDLFKVLGNDHLSGYHLSVYNRWGQKVFETKDYNKGWNGTFNGQLQPAATFVWFCEFNKPGNAEKVKMKGLVTIVQ